MLAAAPGDVDETETHGGRRGHIHSGVGFSVAQGWASHTDAQGSTQGMGPGEGQDRAAGTYAERASKGVLWEAGHAQMQRVGGHRGEGLLRCASCIDSSLALTILKVYKSASSVPAEPSVNSIIATSVRDVISPFTHVNTK